MTKLTQKSAAKPDKTVSKPFLTGSPTDENTLKSSLFFFGSLLITYMMTFIVCATTSAAGLVIRLIMNAAVFGITLVIFFNNGTNQGAEAVARGEILHQKSEKGKSFSSSEQSVCFHPAKGFLIGLFGTLPLFLAALVFAFMAQIQSTEAGTLPSWMQAYLRRSDIANALVQYTEAEGMGFVDILRVVVRIAVMPFVNMIGSGSRTGMLSACA